jgi:DNA repair exonuclease SbcCD ATPase subunit
MTISIKNLTVKNFMSVGNATQAVNFDRQDLTLVLGENLDLGGDGSRNGTGKTTIVNALSYALYGNALSNIRKDNLVNKTNSKHMLVSLDFAVNGQAYRIERGRKPNVLKFYVNSEEQTATDESQGDSRETQEAIEAVLGMSHDMFKHILALNTYTEPFLSLKANEQRAIIEQLLGITQLSERAERIKELNRSTKEALSQEEFRIRAVQEANRRIEEQIESLKKRQRLWVVKRDEDAAAFAQAIADLEQINIEQEIQSHRDLEIFHNNSRARAAAEREIKNIEANIARLEKTQATLTRDIESLKNHQCHACGQEVHDDKQDEILKSKQQALEENADAISDYQDDIESQQDILEQLGVVGPAPRVFYDTLEDALNHRNSLDTLTKNLSSRLAETDPYQEQIEDMQHQALQEVNYNTVNELNRLLEHQEFLLKLLTSKDSFVRKKIIDQNLSYLNGRLTHYLDRIGLPHTVKFQNDLTVSIEEYGRELDFDNLSRGERTRLILGMCWAFRDVWESLYQPINLLFIDELMDNGLDTQGVESGLALLKKMSRERNKSIWLVSHRDELAGRVENILKVVKEHGFTNYNSDIEMQ